MFDGAVPPGGEPGAGLPDGAAPQGPPPAPLSPRAPLSPPPSGALPPPLSPPSSGTPPIPPLPDDHLTASALARGIGRPLLAAIWPVAALAAFCAALAGAAVGARLPLPQDNPLAQFGATTALAGAAAVALAICLAWLRGEKAAVHAWTDEDGPPALVSARWSDLRTRGASNAQIARLLTLAGLPTALASVGTGLLAGLLSAVAVTVATDHASSAAATRTATAAAQAPSQAAAAHATAAASQALSQAGTHAPAPAPALAHLPAFAGALLPTLLHALAWGAVAALLVALTGLLAAALLAFRPAAAAAGGLHLGAAGGLHLPWPHSRSGPDRPGWPSRLGLDVLSLLAALILAWEVDRYIGSLLQPGPAGSQAQAFLTGGIPAYGAHPAGPIVPTALIAAGSVIALLGSAMLAGRLLSFALGLVDRSRGAHLPVVIALVLRAIGRGVAPLRLTLVPGLAAAAIAFTVSGGLGLASTDRTLHAVAVGAPVKLSETWIPGCASGCTQQRKQPLPIDLINSTLVGVAQDATIVYADTDVAGAGPGHPVRLAAIDPAPFAAVADWRFVPGGPQAVAQLGRYPNGAIISTSLAAATGLRAGSRMHTALLPNLRVLAVLPEWPGIGVAIEPWAVVDWNLLAPALQQSATYAEAGLQADVLARMAPGATVKDTRAAALPSGLHISDVTTAGSAGWGLGRLPVVLLPEVLAVLWLTWMALRVPLVDPAALPIGLALAALAAESEVRRARGLLRSIVLWAGCGWGVAAGTGLGALFWGSVRLEPGGVLPVPFRPSWVGLVPAAALWAIGAWALTRAAGAEARRPPDHLVLERVLARARGTSGEMREAQPPTIIGTPTRDPRRSALPGLPAGIRTLAGLRLAAARTLRLLAGIPTLAGLRLAASWKRLPGLAAGILLASVVAATVPLFNAGALTRVLHQGLHPADQRPAGAVLVTAFPTAAPYDARTMQGLAGVATRAGRAAGTTQTPAVEFLASGVGEWIPATGPGSDGSGGVFLEVDSMIGFAAHATFSQGGPPPTRAEADGTIDVAAPAETMRERDLRVGQVYLLQQAAGAPLRFRVTGVFSEALGDGTYWPYLYLERSLFAAPQIWQDLVVTRGVLPMGEATWYTVTDLSHLTAETVPGALHSLARYAVDVQNAAPGATLAKSPYRQLEDFSGRAATVGALLRLAGAPTLGLTLYFVMITAGLIVGAEAGEIAVLLSRGARPLTVACVYLAEWILLAIPLALIAPIPAIAFARLMGGAAGFLHFAHRAPLPVLLLPRDFAYAAGAAALAVLAALIPVLTALGRSIVAARARASRTIQAPLWQRVYLDAAILGALAVAWLGARGINGSGGGAAAIASDPALYAMPALFLVATGLLALRLTGWVLRTADRRWGAALRTSAILPIRRVGRLPAQFAPVLLLLALTAGLGTYSAAAARTLDANLSTAIHYQVGAQVRFEETSPCSLDVAPPPVCAQYFPADHVPPPPRPLPPFQVDLTVPGVARGTPIVEEPLTVSAGGRSVGATLLLVDPATFPATAWWGPGIDPLPEARYMQLLTSAPNAVVASPGLPVAAGGTTQAQVIDGPAATLRVAAALTHWPGADVAGPIVVAKASAAAPIFGITCTPGAPCAASRIDLLDLTPGTAIADVEAGLTGKGLAVTRSDAAPQEIAAALSTPEWAGQTGMLSVGFLVALAVAAIGYLLYASVLLRSQVGQIGLLRALGLDWNTVVGLLAFEQAGLVVTGTITGVLAGFGACVWFLPLFRPAFTGPNTPPFQALGPGIALLEVAVVVLAVFAVALVLLIALLRRLRVNESVVLED